MGPGLPSATCRLSTLVTGNTQKPELAKNLENRLIKYLEEIKVQMPTINAQYDPSKPTASLKGGKGDKKKKRGKGKKGKKKKK